MKNIFKIFNKKESKAVKYKTVQKFISNPDFPWLISFPRTGSHWLRMIMELYFEKPSLVRIFYPELYKNAKEFTCYHQHDKELKDKPKNVIYLYREPAPTIYSQMKYEKEDILDENRIKYWADLYGKHLSKWLIEENFTIKKTIITYEEMQKNIMKEFKKVCDFFGEEIIESKLNKILPMVNKTELKKKTTHDQQVVNLNSIYQEQRNTFIETNSNLIMDIISKINTKLVDLFNEK